jgi:hypothetical protein
VSVTREDLAAVLASSGLRVTSADDTDMTLWEWELTFARFEDQLAHVGEIVNEALDLLSADTRDEILATAQEHGVLWALHDLGAAFGIHAWGLPLNL